MFLTLCSRNFKKFPFINTGKQTRINMNIKNFIFLDLETTGLPYEECNRTKITEISLIAVQSEHISLGVYPRVQNKLKLCFNPCKMISLTASHITGLTNELLEYQFSFDEKSCNVIKAFLELYRKPICFVAHNGNRFDYPILKAEFYKAGCQLQDDILCIDSLQLFRDLDEIEVKSQEAEDKTQTSLHNAPTQIIVNNLPTQKNMPIEFCDGFDEILCEAVDNLEKSFQSNEMQIINENTPKKLSASTAISNNQSNNRSQDDYYYIPSTSKDNMNTGVSTSIQKGGTNSTESKTSVKKRLKFGKPTYKLGDIYSRLTNKINENAHNAEEDVNMLIECAATVGQNFVDWANVNAKALSTIPMMAPGKKLGL